MSFHLRTTNEYILSVLIDQIILVPVGVLLITLLKMGDGDTAHLLA